MGFVIRVSGLKAASRELQALPGDLISAAESAVNQTADSARTGTIRRVGERYNLSEETLGRAIFVRRASVKANLVSGSVEVQVKAVPLTAFDPRVVIVRKRLSEAFGRQTRGYTRSFAQVRLALYRGKAARVLPGAFPLRQRAAGALGAGEGVRRRIGAERGRLTGYRYYTFPKRLTDAALKAVQRESGPALGVAYRVALRTITRRGERVLRYND